MSKYYLLLAFDALLFGAVAMSLDLLIGYTGLVSFGHAAFFGLGAYSAAVLLERGVTSLWLSLGAIPGGRRPVRAPGELLRHHAPGHLLRPADPHLRRGGLHRLPLHADLRRLRRHPGAARAEPPARRARRHAGAELLPGRGLPVLRLSRVPDARLVPLRPRAGRDPRERGPRALPRLRRAALQDGRVHDLGAADRARPAPSTRGARPTPPRISCTGPSRASSSSW